MSPLTLKLLVGAGVVGLYYLSTSGSASAAPSGGGGVIPPPPPPRPIPGGGGGDQQSQESGPIPEGTLDQPSVSGAYFGAPLHLGRVRHTAPVPSGSASTHAYETGPTYHVYPQQWSKPVDWSQQQYLRTQAALRGRRRYGWPWY